MTKPRPRKTKHATRQAAVDKLYNAVNAYVKTLGGKPIVIGGIEVQEWPTDPKFCFRIAIKCMGGKPERWLHRNRDNSVKLYLAKKRNNGL